MHFNAPFVQRNAMRRDAMQRNATQRNATTASLVSGNSKCCMIMRKSRLCSEIVLNDTDNPAATRHAALTTPFTPSYLDPTTAAAAFRARDLTFVMAYFRHAKLQSGLSSKLASIFTLRYTERNRARRSVSSRRFREIPRKEIQSD